jgi:ABC-type proline/glycine betaine transport system ATPase subunit
MTDPRIRIEDLSLKRGGKTVIQHVNLSVAVGEIVCLIGASGSGKSTVLRCINRLLEPPPGTVFLDHVDVTRLDVLSLRRQVGLLLQEPGLFPGSVAENVKYGPRLRGEQLSAGDVADLLVQADLSAQMTDTPVDKLSVGEKQRVALARTLANRPNTLLLDEPTAALDPAATRRIENTIARLRRETALSALWVSHDPEQAGRVADRVVVMAAGNRIAGGTDGSSG